MKKEGKLEKEIEELKKDKKKLDLKIAKEKAKVSVNKFNEELKRSLLTAIVAAFAFILALSWRELIIEYINKLVSLSHTQNKLIEVGIITLISVIGIIIVTWVLKNKNE
jgi:hypothetical protein